MYWPEYQKVTYPYRQIDNMPGFLHLEKSLIKLKDPVFQWTQWFCNINLSPIRISSNQKGKCYEGNALRFVNTIRNMSKM